MDPRYGLAALLGIVLAATAGGTETPAPVPTALPDAPPLPAALRAELARNLASRGAGYEPRTRHRRPDGSPIYTNRLLLESSPYLQQHAHNPVDWRPWGDEAFAEAKRLKRPVLVSIGYSTCHWCHVMEEESFDNVEIARLLNAHFITIKVDREARPDVDAIYMAAIHVLGRGGGWPLNVWVTPERKPFYAGTYFPPQDRDGRPGLTTVLRSLQEEYATNPENVEAYAERLESAIRSRLAGSVATATQIPGPELLSRAAQQSLERVDWTWGGAGRRPKFPSGVPLRFLLRYQRRSGDEEALRAATLSLEKMASGGLYDHVGGGFHRYSTDQEWLVPHFEKMLYDNALLALVYLEAWQVTGNEAFARVTRDVLGYVQREMTAPEGGFYSATDADSRRPDGEMEEGWFFTWTPEEVEEVLGSERARVVSAWFGITPGGNFEGRNVLHVARDEAEVAEELGLETANLREILDEARPALYAARRERPAPLRDEKILAAWNGLMISAFARAGLALDEPAYVDSAARAADFALERMRAQGRLRRVYTGGRASGPAFLEDYAFLIGGLIDLYEASPDPRWLREALGLQEVLDARYADETGGGYFQTADDHEALLVREKPANDGALPSGNSVGALNLLRLADLTSNDRHRQRAGLLFSAFRDDLERTPTAFGDLLIALEYHHDTAKEIVLVRPTNGGDLDAMLAPLRRTFVPNRVLSVVTQGPDLEAHGSLVPLVSGKRARRGEVTAYVCENRVCDLPTEEPAVFARQIAKVRRLGAGPDR